MVTKEQRKAWRKIVKENHYKDKIIKKIIKLYKTILYKKNCKDSGFHPHIIHQKCRWRDSGTACPGMPPIAAPA